MRKSGVFTHGRNSHDGVGCIKMSLRLLTRPAGVEPLEVRFAHPVRLSPDTHSQGHGRPCLQRLHLRRGFSRHMVFPGDFSVTYASLHQILALHLVGVAGCGHAAGLQGVDLQGVMKQGVETWPKNGCVSTPLLNWYLTISELRIRLWPRPDGFSCRQAPTFS